MTRTVHQRADRFLEVVPVPQRVALKIVAARQTQEPRVQGSHAFHQVGTIAVGPIVEGGWHQGYQLQPDGAYMCYRELR